MVYENCKIYGPYVRKDKRVQIFIVFDDGVRKTVSYPKYLMENKLNKYIEPDEAIHHIDNDFTNNSLENLKVIKRNHHSYYHAIKLKKQKFVCPECNCNFVLHSVKLSKAIQNRKRRKSGPFCSKRCAGKYGQKIQMKKMQKLDVVLIKPEYTK